MYFTTVLSSGLLLAGSALAQGQYGYEGGYGSTDMSMPNGGDGAMAVSEPAMETTSTPAMASSSASGSVAASTGSAGVKVHVVQVGDASGSLTFSPADIRAAQGDMVQFHFYPKNHSVVQSSFDQPCQPIGQTHPGTPGVFSGFMPVSANSSVMPTYSVTVNDTKPIWFYCSQGKHCQSGMVGVINPPATNTSRTLESYKAAAAGASQNLSPGQTGSAANSTGTGSGSGSGSTTMSTARAGATGSGSSSSTNSSSPATVSGTGGVGSIRIDGANGLYASLATAGLVAVLMEMFM